MPQKEFAILTAHIDRLKNDPIGTWPEQTGDGSPENPLLFCHSMEYSENVSKFIESVFSFVADNPKYDNSIHQILHRAEKKLGCDPLQVEDYDRLHATTIIALLRLVISMERFSGGTIKEFFDNGKIIKWLERLKRIDADNE